jgi:hypothetical protein
MIRNSVTKFYIEGMVACQDAMAGKPVKQMICDGNAMGAILQPFVAGASA